MYLDWVINMQYCLISNYKIQLFEIAIVRSFNSRGSLVTHNYKLQLGRKVCYRGEAEQVGNSLFLSRDSLSPAVCWRSKNIDPRLHYK